MLFDALQATVARFPQSLAIEDDSATLSYEQLWQKIGYGKELLTRAGVRPGDRVCLLAPNSAQSVVAFWSIIACGAICVHLNEQSPSDALQAIVEDAGPSLITGTQRLAEQRLVSADYRFIDLDEFTTASPQGLTISSSPADADDSIAVIVYTSGSSGKPKGVCLTQRNLASVAGMAGDAYAISHLDRYLMVVPLHYIHGLMMLCTLQLRGASIGFMNSFSFPVAVTRKLQSFAATGFSGVPFHFSSLIDRGGFLQADLPHLRWVGITGGRCSRERLQQIRKAQPQIDIHISYGQTECSPRITALHPDRVDTKAESVGQVAEGLVLELLDENGNSVGENEIGELVVSGPTVMWGYWNDPVATRQVIDAQGRLHTGDLGIMDTDGDVYLKGRVSAMIKSAGERIFPEEIEQVLLTSPHVNEAAVIGVPDALYGQRVTAHVVLTDNNEQTLQEVKAYCLERLAFARAPRQYYCWQALPLKANGKPDHQALLNHNP